MIENQALNELISELLIRSVTMPSQHSVHAQHHSLLEAHNQDVWNLTDYVTSQDVTSIDSFDVTLTS